MGVAAVPRRAGLAAEARAGVDAADTGKAGMGVTLEEEEPLRIRGLETGPLTERRLLGPKGHQPALGRGLPRGAEASVPKVRRDFALMRAET